ncbi:BaiN/RdsA family NAD(P)/FAD-dependent oxidoreductase [Larkinella humicola]|uniref:NAD(P)/FAD-dependent oxidoreductase n=1 Tax=Larkinella humicola TaxID=2607654 RepID=A0A5N1JLQ9_9BACT|nr:NAD(P)/FAD-dependent oxidoreductase [Larkinella humicola]KAA9356377.1 NAD(P)/FAD-dependent oxidoreductase [Larkinella humicola]
MPTLKIVVIGGGAAGFFGAITAAETFPDAEITLLEKSKTVLNKVRISGGGRCNVTHSCFDNRKLVKNYPRGETFLRPLLKQFDATATVTWFESRGVRLKTEADGRMFPVTDSSETIISCLLQEAARLKIRIRTSCGVKTITRPDDQWQIETLTDETLPSDRILVAAGGYPQAVSYGWIPGLDEPEKETLVPPVPSLFTFNTPDNPLLALAGVAVPDAVMRITGTKQEQRGPVLITHWGFSGPAVLRLSAWAARDLAAMHYRHEIRINWLGALNENQVREQMQTFRQQHPKKQVATQSLFGLPARLWLALATEAGISPTERWAELPAKAQNRLINLLTNNTHAVSGKSTFKEEFVTCGGIPTDNVKPETLESRTQPGLFFAGEVLNIDGITGGFNFQNAWTTGYVVGKNIGL